MKMGGSGIVAAVTVWACGLMFGGLAPVSALAVVISEAKFRELGGDPAAKEATFPAVARRLREHSLSPQFLAAGRLGGCTATREDNPHLPPGLHRGQVTLQAHDWMDRNFHRLIELDVDLDTLDGAAAAVPD